MFGIIKPFVALILLLFVYTSAASNVRGNEVLFMYYAYEADWIINGQSTTLAPGLSQTWTGKRPPTLSDFLKAVMDDRFLAVYNADPEAQRICNTDIPDEKEVATFLNNYQPMEHGQVGDRLFRLGPNETPPASHPDRMGRVVQVLQNARAWSMAGGPTQLKLVSFLNDQAVISLDQTILGRIVDTAPQAITALRRSGIAGLNVVTMISEFDGETEVPDMEGTLRASPSLSGADRERLLTYLVNLPRRDETGRHARIVNALDDQMSRLLDSDPTC